MATRHFFRKAIAPPPKPPCESHARKYPKHQLVIAENIHPLTGKRVVRRLDASTAFRKIAASKAGIASQASGRANRFTSESGRKASKKLWTTRQRMSVRPGPPGKVPNTPIRIGNKLTGWKKGQRLDRIAIRSLYAMTPKHGIRCVDQNPKHPVWERKHPEWDVHIRITERTALIRLGYMKHLLRFVPTSVKLMPLRGTKPAIVGTDNTVNPVSGEPT